MLIRVLPFLAALGIVATAWAVQPGEILDDPVLETRARDISKNLRCLVCQNQSIDDSDAPLARDLRIIVRERLQAGDSDGDVIGFVTDRYGDFVLLRPPVKPTTYLLWFGPLALLLCGIVLIAAMARKRRLGAAATASLSEAERQRLAALLDDDEKGGRAGP
ncbi:MAG: cytochrome c-type biogenesis protein CcmH [Alphaproteobacteria bacterium]|nr:cytochrome c-type biogenesis protein CcmH [Alphaproteobacteria bacterium]